MADPSSSRQDKSRSQSRGSCRSSRTSTTDPKIRDKLRHNGVVVTPAEEKVPSDANKIANLLRQGRKSPEPSQLEFDEHHQESRMAYGESYVRCTLWRRFAKFVGYPYGQAEFAWNALREDAAVSTGLSEPKPDLAEYRTTEDDGYPLAAIETLEGMLHPIGPAVPFSTPHFVVEFKNSALHISTAIYQAAYDGACIVESDRACYDFAKKPFPFGKTRALSVRYNGQEMSIDGHFQGLDNREGAGASYHRYQVLTFRPAESFEEYQSAVRAVHNAYDFGREKTEEIRELLVSADASGDIMVVHRDEGHSQSHPKETAGPHTPKRARQ